MCVSLFVPTLYLCFSYGTCYLVCQCPITRLLLFTGTLLTSCLYCHIFAILLCFKICSVSSIDLTLWSLFCNCSMNFLLTKLVCHLLLWAPVDSQMLCCLKSLLQLEHSSESLVVLGLWFFCLFVFCFCQFYVTSLLTVFVLTLFFTELPQHALCAGSSVLCLWLLMCLHPLFAGMFWSVSVCIFCMNFMSFFVY